MAASGEDAGRCGRRHKEFSFLEQEEDSSKSWKGKNGGELRGAYPHTSQKLSLLTADSGAVPNSEPPKPARLNSEADAPLTGKSLGAVSGGKLAA